MSLETWLVPKPLPNHGLSRMTFQVCCHTVRRDPNTPCSRLPLYKNTEPIDSDPFHEGASVCRGTRTTAHIASSTTIAVPLISTRYSRNVTHTSSDEIMAAMIEAREKLLNRRSRAIINSVPKRSFLVRA